jgi:hypothetical protein
MPVASAHGLTRIDDCRRRSKLTLFSKHAKTRRRSGSLLPLQWVAAGVKTGDDKQDFLLKDKE